MSPASCLTTASALALLFTSSAFAGAAPNQGAVHSVVAHRAASPVVTSPAPPRIAHAPAIAQPPMAKSGVTQQRLHFSTQMVRPVSVLTNPMTQRHQNGAPRLMHLADPVHHRHAGQHFHRGQRIFPGFVSPSYASAYSPAPEVITQRAIEYVPVERPLTSAYGEPQIIPAFAPCDGPAVHHVRPMRHTAPLPQVIYGLQPQCGPSGHAEAPAHVRAAY